jgi:hypothetical protein
MVGIRFTAPYTHPRQRLSRRLALCRGAAMLAMAGIGGWRSAAAQEGTPLPGRDGDLSDGVLEALQTSRAWINYSPVRPFDFIAGQHPVTEEQLQTELELLCDFGFRGLVTNVMTYGLEAAPFVAKRIGFRHVIAKLWWADDATLEIEKHNVEGAIADIDALVMGNETLHKAALRGESSDDALARLRQEIEGLQRAYGKPVTTGLHRDE